MSDRRPVKQEPRDNAPLISNAGGDPIQVDSDSDSDSDSDDDDDDDEREQMPVEELAQCSKPSSFPVVSSSL